MGRFKFNGRVQCLPEADSWCRYTATVASEEGFCGQNISRSIREGHCSVTAATFRVSKFLVL